MAEGWVNIDGDNFDLDAVLPEQYNHPVAEYTPEQRLMAAVLADAIRLERRGDPEAAEWIWLGDPGWTYSFVNVCEALRLDPHRIKDLIMEDYLAGK